MARVTYEDVMDILESIPEVKQENNSLRVQLAILLQKKRLEVGITQEALVKRVSQNGHKITQATISKMESGEGDVLISSYDKVFQALDVYADALLMRERQAGNKRVPAGHIPVARIPGDFPTALVGAVRPSDNNTSSILDKVFKKVSKRQYRVNSGKNGAARIIVNTKDDAFEIPSGKIQPRIKKGKKIKSGIELQRDHAVSYREMVSTAAKNFKKH